MQHDRPLYYHNALLTDSDYSDISLHFKIPYDTVLEVIAQIRADGQPMFHAYSGVLRQHIEELAEVITDRPQEAQLEPRGLSEQHELVDSAATHLMRALIDPLGGNFVVTPEGIITINPDSPPSLETAYQVVSDVIKLKDIGATIDDKGSWMLGSIVSELSKYFGENNFHISQICAQTDKAWQTLWCACKVYEAFPRRYNVCFSTHKEVFFKRLSDDPDANAAAQAAVLHKCETYGLGPKMARELCSIVQRMDGDTQVIKNIRSKGQAEDLIKAYRDSKVTYLVLTDSKTCKEIKGTTESIPTGLVVIDLKNMTWRKDNGAPLPIERMAKNKPKDKASKP